MSSSRKTPNRLSRNRRLSGTRRLRTVLFTDLVGHTEMMSRLGDERGRAVLREHERITREVLKANGGTEVKTMGDGFMASFGSVTRAVECAIALQRAFAEREGEPLNVRVGLNAGEPIEEDGDLFGATVILTSRIAAKAEGGEILDGPDGVYAFVGKGVRSDYQPVNGGSGLALGNPTDLNTPFGAPSNILPNENPNAYQSYSHYVMPGGLVESFIDAIGTRRGGSLAPTVRLKINGSTITVDKKYGDGGLGGYGDIPANKRYRG